jgi:GH24 family phage-related lysozyme (muramidase)
MGAIQSVTIALCLFLAGCNNQAAVIEPVGKVETEQPIPAPEPAPTAEPTPPEQVIELPATLGLTDGARKLILEFEGFDHKPDWPQGASGVTIAIGYDCGYNSNKVIKTDWHELQSSWRDRLADTSGLVGRKAQAVISGLRDIYVTTDIGSRVFDNVDVPREYDNCSRFMPGCENLRPNAQGAIMSLGYNRGWGMTGDSRREMRNIRDLVPKKDYGGIANEIRKMKRIWEGTVIQNGMNRRRDAEARLVETP